MISILDTIMLEETPRKTLKQLIKIVITTLILIHP